MIFGELGVRTEKELEKLLIEANLRVTRVAAAGQAGTVVEAARASGQ